VLDPAATGAQPTPVSAIPAAIGPHAKRYEAKWYNRNRSPGDRDGPWKQIS